MYSKCHLYDHYKRHNLTINASRRSLFDGREVKMIPLPVTHSPFGERHTKIIQRPTSQCKIIFLPESIAWIAYLDFQVHVGEAKSLR